MSQPMMPGLLADENAPFSDSDPATSHEGGPTPGRGVRDPSNAGIDDPVTMYGRQLWTELDNVARYLREEVARGGSGPLLSESKPLLGTEDQWQRWREVYARVLSILAGPAGDQGYGHQEALLEYQNGHQSP
jgi:hypothetical protein